MSKLIWHEVRLNKIEIVVKCLAGTFGRTKGLLFKFFCGIFSEPDRSTFLNPKGLITVGPLRQISETFKSGYNYGVTAASALRPENVKQTFKNISGKVR